MLPVAPTTSAVIPPPTIVATAIPGNHALRVPVDNVAPPVSNARIENNTRSNGGTYVGSVAMQTTAAPSPTMALFSAWIGSVPTNLSLNAGTTFMAQLMSQDNSPPAQTVLAEYEKLVNIAQVKYKPSNAGQPEAEPASVFGQLLKQDKEPRANTPVTTFNAPIKPLRITKAVAAAPSAVNAYRATFERSEAQEKESIAEI